MYQNQYARPVPVNWVNDYVGIPWEQLDCWHLVCKVYRDRLGVELPEYSGVDPKDVLAVARTMRQERDLWDKVADFRDYDVVLMRGMVEKERKHIEAPTHCGVVVHGRMVLHTHVEHASACVPVSDPTVKFRILGYYRYAAR